jgi:hypothetical protein
LYSATMRRSGFGARPTIRMTSANAALPLDAGQRGFKLEDAPSALALAVAVARSSLAVYGERVPLAVVDRTPTSPLLNVRDLEIRSAEFEVPANFFWREPYNVHSAIPLETGGDLDCRRSRPFLFLGDFRGATVEPVDEALPRNQNADRDGSPVAIFFFAIARRLAEPMPLHALAWSIFHPPPSGERPRSDGLAWTRLRRIAVLRAF